MGILIPGNSIGHSSAGVAFDDDRQESSSGQTEFSADFDINEVFVDNIIRTIGWTGKGTKTITFTSGLIEFQEVYLTTG